MDITLSRQFPLVILTGLAMNLHATSQVKDISQKRQTIFPVQFMEKIYGKQHKKYLKQDISAGGYPDTGSGFYSQKLSYKDWYDFNVLQRIHLNYLESLPLSLTSLFAAGIYQPKAASIVGGTYILFRILYRYFYKNQGPKSVGRKISSFGSLACSLVNIGIFFYFGYKVWNKQ